MNFMNFISLEIVNRTFENAEHSKNFLTFCFEDANISTFQILFPGKKLNVVKKIGHDTAQKISTFESFSDF